MIRTQIQLTDEQARSLRHEANLRGISMAAVLRELVDDALRAPARAQTARARGVVGRFASGEHRTAREHDAALEQAFRA
jgi:hypothetical protein